MANRRISHSMLMPLLLVVTWATGCLAGYCAPSKSDMWSALRGCGLGSVAWSPKGDRIAFVVAAWKDNRTDGEGGLNRNGIWIASLSKQNQWTSIKRLVTLEHRANGEGVATVLFWLDNDRVGWATQGGLTYTFMQMSLHDKKPKRLVNRVFNGHPSSDSQGGNAPGDVYYDAASRTLLFSGSLAPTGVFVRMLSLSTETVRDLSISTPKGLVDPQIDVVTLCGSLRNPEKPVFYIAAAMSDEAHSGGWWHLWRSNSYSLKEDKVIATEGAMWPRTSPDGKLLAYFQDGKLVLYDLASDKHKVLVKPSGADSPAGGWCSYSWSPDGKKIAYVDGPKIEITNVP